MTLQVLVVDDVPAMAEQYAYDLKRVGRYTTTVAAGGDAALDLLAREPIDCVVLDLDMPGTDGFEVLRRLQQRGIDTPVILKGSWCISRDWWCCASSRDGSTTGLANLRARS